MNHEDLREIIYLLNDKDISELAIERGNETLRIKRFVAGHTNVQLQPAVAVSSGVMSIPAPIPAFTGYGNGDAGHAIAVKAVEEELHLVKSHTVGIFREANKRGPQPATLPGDAVKVDQTVGFIEVLKLLNDVRSDVTGEVVKRLVSDGQPVEYGQALFAVRIRN